MIKLPRPGPTWRRLCWWLQRGEGAIILRYHRITDERPHPWPVCVSPRHFNEHLEVMRRHANVVPLAGLAQAIIEGRRLDRAVVITFDDGYADNLHAAKPLLERYEAPATVFLTTGHFGAARELWWDELERLVVVPAEIPDELELRIRGHVHRWWSGGRAVGDGDSRQHRLRMYYEIWRLLQPLPAFEQWQVLDELRRWAKQKVEVRAARRVLAANEVLKLVDDGLVEVGAHTVNHPLLPCLDATAQEEEIRQSKITCEMLLSRPVRVFAYPFGRSAPQTRTLVRDAGFLCACTCEADIVHSGSRCDSLPRAYVGDWDGAEFEKRLTRALFTP